MINIFFPDVSYTNPICPYIFLNTNLVNLGLYQITNSLIFKNRLRFMNKSDEISLAGGLNSNFLEYLELNLVFEELNGHLLSPHIFKSIKTLQITGSPFLLDENLFEFFVSIEFIFMSVDNLRNLFQQGLKWTHHLNSDLNVNIDDVFQLRQNSNQIKIIQFNQIFNRAFATNVYIYPDEDLCLFKTFPHKQLIIPSIYMYDEIKCSCTIIWLIRNQRVHLNIPLTNVKMARDFEFFLQNFSLIHWS